jgi:hypothetical protein
MSSKARAKRKYVVEKNQECNEFLLLNIRYKSLFKVPLNRVNIETQVNRSITAYRPVKSRTVTESPVTDDCLFLLSLMPRDWACSTNYIEKLPDIKKKKHFTSYESRWPVDVNWKFKMSLQEPEACLSNSAQTHYLLQTYMWTTQTWFK